MRIRHNLQTLQALNGFKVHQMNDAKNLQKLASGFRINRAGDDAAGLSISEKMRGQISGLHTANKNASDGISLIQTAEGALNETHSMLQRIRELAVQAANDTNTNEDRQKLQLEVDSLLSGIQQIANETQFNTKTLLNGTTLTTANPIILQVGTNSGQSMHLTLKDDATLKGLGLEKTIQAPGTYSYDKIPLTFSYSSTTESASIGALFSNVQGDLTFNLHSLSSNIQSYLDSSFKVEGKGHIVSLALQQSDDSTVLNDFKYNVFPTIQNYIATASNNALTIKLKSSSNSKLADLLLTLELTAQQNTATYNASKGGYEFSLFNNVEFFYKSEEITSEAAIKALGEQATAQEIATFMNKEIEKITEALEKHSSTNVQLYDRNGQALSNNSYTFSRFSVTGNTNNLGFTYTESEGETISTISIATQKDANDAITTIDKAISIVSGMRSQLGAYQNRLEYTMNNLHMTAENLTAAESRIRDTDFAKEMMDYTKNQVLTQAAQAMMAQSNQAPSQILRLLETA